LKETDMTVLTEKDLESVAGGSGSGSGKVIFND
jgi:bacteriocin-like protein